MSQMQVDSVLAQIRALSPSGGLQKPAGLAPPGAPAAAGAPAFGELLRKSLDAVNSTQQSAGALADAFQRGDRNVDLASVMLETQKASVSFRALTEVRNRLVNVYQDIMNMPI
jgi:flagellar hook-basal body complex protein FliE